MSFWEELRRRNVFKVGAAYALVTWILAQVVSVVNEPLSLPPWFAAVTLVLLAIGFPIALLFAWAYELTPAGLRRSEDVPIHESVTHITGKRLNYVVTGLLCGALLGSGAAWLLNRDVDGDWARREAIPRIEAYANSDNWEAAFTLAQEVERRAPGTPELAELWPRFSSRFAIRSTPSAARVWRRPYESGEDDWVELARTPIEGVRLPSGLSRLRLELEGHVPLDTTLRVPNWQGTEQEIIDATIDPFGRSRPFRLDTPESLPPGTVRVPGWQQEVDGELVIFEDFFLDRHEVTNREYKAFVEDGGYASSEYWRYPIVDAGEEIAWQDAIARFTDRTGRPGPSTWVAGDYPEEEDDYPVGGISWYEAAAYAEYAGAELPTWYHSVRATDPFESSWVLEASNIQSDGPRPVGESSAMSWSGAYDLGGNVREWIFNHVADEAFILGGSWKDQRYVGSLTNYTQPLLDRSATNGFRLMRTSDRRATWEIARRRMPEVTQRDLSRIEPISEEVFAIYARLHNYDRTPLDAVVEERAEARDWVRERVSLAAGYGGERMVVYLYLPRANGPFQTVVFAPHAGAWTVPTIEHLGFHLDFIVKNGRSVAVPVYKGTLERRDEFGAGLDRWHLNAGRDRLIRITQDFRRTLDYLETRPEIDEEGFAFYGVSLGGVYGPAILALESRLKAAVIEIGGVHPAQRFLPEVDPMNFVPRVRLPVLMLNGTLDSIVPLRSGAIPYFERIGTSRQAKRQVILPGGHFVPREDAIRESLEWLDKYLGRVH